MYYIWTHSVDQIYYHQYYTFTVIGHEFVSKEFITTLKIYWLQTYIDYCRENDNITCLNWGYYTPVFVLIILSEHLLHTSKSWLVPCISVFSIGCTPNPVKDYLFFLFYIFLNLSRYNIYMLHNGSENLWFCILVYIVYTHWSLESIIFY